MKLAIQTKQFSSPGLLSAEITSTYHHFQWRMTLALGKNEQTSQMIPKCIVQSSEKLECIQKAAARM